MFAWAAGRWVWCPRRIVPDPCEISPLPSRMTEICPSGNLLQDIDARQDEVLRQLIELEQRLERVLAGCAGFCRPAAAPTLLPISMPGQPASHANGATAADASIAAIKVA